MDISTDPDLSHEELWRRQCALNLMDCYAMGVRSLMERPLDKDLGTLVRLMVDGMTAARGREDEMAFYRAAASQCRACEEKNPLFGTYAVIFEDLGQKGGKT